MRKTIDEVVAAERDTRTLAEQARDQARANAQGTLDSARLQVEQLKRTNSAAAHGPAMTHALKRLADAEQAAQAAGVTL